DMPVFLKREVTDQFPGLKKDNLKHSVYATKSIHELFEGQFLKKAEVKLFNYASSIVAINNGKGNFNVQRLPTRLQLSSVNAISAADFNGDGFTDLITGGNLFTFPPQFGRLDGSYGDLLLNNKKGGFSWVNNSTSGFNWRGEVKDIKLISIGKKQHILITQNNIVPVLLQGGAVK
ncbi:MAG: FG-GAP repeat protein, partial [Chitinophagaceae bacterium]